MLTKKNQTIIIVWTSNLGNFREINNQAGVYYNNNPQNNRRHEIGSINILENNANLNAVRNPAINHEVIISNPGANNLANIMPYLPSNNDPNFNFPEISNKN